LLLYRAVTILALSLFPPANYLALRWLGLRRDTACWGAFLSCLIAAHASYGIEMESFTWTGWGLFAQAVALPLLPLALAGGWRAVHEHGRTLRFATILAAAFLAHILYGYIAVLSLALTPFMSRRAVRVAHPLLRLARFYAQAFALIAFFIVPLMLDLPYHARSLYDEAAKFDSHGAVVILTRLFTGTLLDDQRLPVMTCLALAGLFLCARQWLQRGSAVHGWISCGFLMWVLLYFGRATWGPIADLLPMSHGLHMERLSSGVHIFAIWLAAIALGALWRWCVSFEAPALRSLCIALGVMLLLPVVAERIRYFVYDAQNVVAAKQEFDANAAELEPVLRALRDHPGRVYAGRSGNWGEQYKVGRVQVYHLLSAEAITQVAHAPYSWALTTDSEIQLDWPDESTYQLYDVDYLLTDQNREPPPGAELVVRSGRHRLYRLPSEGPFGLASVPLGIAGDKDAVWYMNMSWLKSAWPKQRAHARLLLTDEQTSSPVVRMLDPFRYVLPQEREVRNVFDPPGLFGEPPPAPTGSITSVFSSRQEASATAELDQPGAVLFKTTYHPGWGATVDGAPVRTMALTPGLIGVPVPAGVHTLHMAYRPGWWKTTLLCVGVLLAVLIDRTGGAARRQA
jgi:Bacterial membrane protein YfhO